MKIEGACHPVISVCPFKLDQFENRKSVQYQSVTQVLPLQLLQCYPITLLSVDPRSQRKPNEHSCMATVA